MNPEQQKCLQEAQNDPHLDMEWRENISSILQGEKDRKNKEKLDNQKSISEQKFLSCLVEDSRFQFHQENGTVMTAPQTEGVLQRANRGEHKKFMEPDGCKQKCKVCGEKFLNSHYFTQHYKAQHYKTFSCPICGKTFNRKYNMSRHQMTHK